MKPKLIILSILTAHCIEATASKHLDIIIDKPFIGTDKLPDTPRSNKQNNKPGSANNELNEKKPLVTSDKQSKTPEAKPSKTDQVDTLAIIIPPDTVIKENKEAGISSIFPDWLKLVLYALYFLMPLTEKKNTIRTQKELADLFIKMLLGIVALETIWQTFFA